MMKHFDSRRIVRVIGLMSAAAMATIAVAGRERTTDQREHQVSVELAWQAPEIHAAALDFTNDLGYRIHVTMARVTTYSVELIPCDVELFRKLQQPPQTSSIDVIARANAAHAPADRPTRTVVAITEDALAATSRTLLDRVSPPPYRYCEAHYLVGRDAPSKLREKNRPPRSVVIAGTYVAPDTTGVVPFQIETGIAHGIVVPLIAANGEAFAATLPAGAKVVVARNLAAAFDGIDFAAMQSPEAARQFLRSLMAETRVTVETKS